MDSRTVDVKLHLPNRNETVVSSHSDTVPMVEVISDSPFKSSNFVGFEVIRFCRNEFGKLLLITYDEKLLSSIGFRKQ